MSNLFLKTMVLVSIAILIISFTPVSMAKHDTTGKNAALWFLAPPDFPFGKPLFPVWASELGVSTDIYHGDSVDVVYLTRNYGIIVMVLQGYGGTLDEQTVKTLAQYVKRGGNLIISNEETGTPKSNVNLLLMKFGIKYDSSFCFPGPQTLDVITRCPLTSGVEHIFVDGTCSLTIVSKKAYSIQMQSSTETEVLVAYSIKGQGKVVALSDGHVIPGYAEWSYLYPSDQKIFTQNIIEWLKT